MGPASAAAVSTTSLGRIAIAGWSIAGVLAGVLGTMLWRMRALRLAANVAATQFAASDNELGKSYAEEPLLRGLN
jgi:hypothetical protein